jgi:Ca2+-binding RTX toxin-like protein
MTNILFNRSSTPPGNRTDWSLDPDDNANYTPANFALITDGFSPLPSHPGLFLTTGSATTTSANIEIPFALLNSLENIEMNYNGAANIHVANFAHVDIETNVNNSNGNSTVDVVNAQRGDITTGNGNDVVSISVLDSMSGEDNSHQFHINTGKGDDGITLTNGSFVTDQAELFIDMGAGNDVISAEAFFYNKIYVDAGAGHDLVIGGFGNDTLNAGAGNDAVFGSWGNDVINGGKGNDFLWGEDGNDVIEGGAGDDRINGGDGNDTISGGAGQNAYIFTNRELGDTAFTDTITDFSHQDWIEFLGTGLSFEDLTITQSAADTHIQYTDNAGILDTIILTGVDSTSMEASDFAFA